MALEQRSPQRGSRAPFPAFDVRPGESAASPYLRALRRHWLVAALVVLATLVGAGVWMTIQESTYQADAELLVNPVPRDDATLLSLPLVKDTGDPTRTIQTAAELVDSHDAAEKAAGLLGGDWTRSKVESATDVSPQGQTNLIEIVAQASSAEEAAAVANAFAEAALEVRRETLRPLAENVLEQVNERLDNLSDPRSPAVVELERARGQLEAILAGEDPSLSVSQLAVPPGSPLGLPTWMVLGLTLIAGLVLATGSALLLEVLLPDRLGSEDDLLGVFPAPILARIPRLSRDRVRPDPRDLEMDPVVREAFRTVHLQLDRDAERKRAIMIASASRGDGKTTAAANFALELAATGALVIAVDGDVRKPDLGRVLGVGRGAVPDVGSAALPTDDPLKPVPGQSSLWLLDLSEIGDLQGAGRYQRMRGLITGMLNAVDYVVVDTPPLGEVSDALMLLDEIDDVVVVSRMGNTRRLSAEIARDLLDRAGVQIAGFLVVGGRKTASRYPYGGA